MLGGFHKTTDTGYRALCTQNFVPFLSGKFSVPIFKSAGKRRQRGYRAFCQKIGLFLNSIGLFKDPFDSAL